MKLLESACGRLLKTFRRARGSLSDKPLAGVRQDGIDLVSIHQAILQLWSLAQSHGARELEFELDTKNPRYGFSTANGKRGVGSLSPDLVAALPRWRQDVESVRGGPYTGFQVREVKKGKLLFSPRQVEKIACLFLDDQPVYGALLQKRCLAEGLKLELVQEVGVARSRLMDAPGKYGMFLCDVHLGADSGIEMVRSLRNSGHRGAIAMVSSDGTVDVQRAALEAGADAYFVKNEDPAVILAFMKRVLEEQRV